MQEYAIIDIETTGGNSEHHRIIEIAVFVHNGKKVIEQWETLINPDRTIPPYIEGFTGITNEMVGNAPYFADIADKLAEITKGRVFVAHNVNFDYGFIRKEFNQIGRTFKRTKLCTVRLSRQLIPDLPSYGLASICQSMSIPINGRHRAAGDGEATAKLFTILLERDNSNYINEAVKRGSKEAVLPPNLPREQFDALPEKTGVYYFLDSHGKLLYIGKAKNIKQRVTNHFQGNTNTRSRQLFMERIWGVDFEVCGNELIALLHESSEIKKHWPPMNRAQKNLYFQYGIFDYEDQAGYRRLSISKVNKYNRPLITFYSVLEARNWLFGKVREYELCPKFSGLQQSPNECHDYAVGICKGACGEHETSAEYNKRISLLFENLNQNDGSYAVIGQGRDKEESSVVLIEDGKYRGYTYLRNDLQISTAEELSGMITSKSEDNPDIQSILRSFLAKDKQQKIIELA